ncbi:zwei Ig domain protein zig-8-like [Neocloeon triangulifer]|uniref:zwei Ig domain protein zig-8-like n=1 Tax=Neocloeon triangulifer TaxID=2078957 RepID=UPI00286F59C3|nr:zwei Ig domain protein zig-8-like [Neocloeon triangulifer]XP_059474121.1 zwei Ig domain protein zig-8-like [Neocloeon triangulifer]
MKTLNPPTMGKNKWAGVVLLSLLVSHVICQGEKAEEKKFKSALPPPPPPLIEIVHTDVPHEETQETVSPPPVFFATENSTVVTAQTGSTALVPCVVKNIGDGVISWIRRKDYHLLTVGLTTYSSDDRYQAVHAQHSEDWTLQVKFVQERDAGLYECQVTSHPPTSIFIELRVVEARAEIVGPAEKFLKTGSTLKLSCVLRQSTQPPLFVFWYHNNRMINYDVDRGVNVSADESRTSSTLVISAAQRTHSGNYSCVPNNAQPASTYVHVLNAGENPAAMQTGGRGLSWLRSPSVWLLVGCVVLTVSAGRGLEAAPSRTQTVLL